MLFTFDFQMFAEDEAAESTISIPGIDDDIAQAIADEIPQEEAADADTHSDNKEEQAEEVEEGSSIPYNRFKSVNDRMKAAEARQKELEAEIERYKSQASVPQAEEELETPAPEEPNQQAQGMEFNVEQMKRMTAEARRRAAAQLNLSDEDIENMEYADDDNLKDTYNALTTKYMAQVEGEVRNYVKSVNDYQSMLQTTRSEYAKAVNEFKSLDNFNDIWAEVGKKANEKGPRFANMLQDSINRLDKGKGTYQDLYLVENYVRGIAANMQSPAINKANVKIKNAANLPRATEVGGTTKGDTTYDVATITQMMNEGRWDEIPEDVQRKVMRGAI